MSLKILSPFGPKMAQLSLPKSLVAKINQEVDKIITNNMPVSYTHLRAHET